MSGESEFSEPEQELLGQLRQLEEELLRLERNGRAEEIASTFRTAHNLKSAAAMLGFEEVAAIIHDLEEALDRLRAGELRLTGDLITSLLTRTDAAVIQLGKLHRAEQDHSAQVPTAMLRRVRVRISLASDSLRTGIDPLRLLRALTDLGKLVEASVDASQLPSLAQLDPQRLYLAFVMVLDTDATDDQLRSVFLFVDDRVTLTIALLDSPARQTQSPSQPAQDEVPQDHKDSQHAQPQLVNQTLKIQVRRVDALVTLAGELSVATSRLSALQGMGLRMSDQRVSSLCHEIRHLASRLQEAAMAIRLVPISTAFSPLLRVVRDQAYALGKEVEVVQRGAQTELDKMVADRLLAPLKHLVRNALDHGVESPEERRRSGKSHRARIDLEAWQEHGKVIVRVRDDGRGLDLTRIEKVAVERGLIPPGRKLGEQEACALLLVPGFTTRDQVSPLSGRGVGLDVVRQNIYDLGGDLDVKTGHGIGMSVTLSVPLTLAMVEGITLQCEKQLFSLPLDVVERIIRPTPAQCLRLPGGGEVIRASGASVPLLRLEKLLHLQSHAPTGHAPSLPAVVVLVAGLHSSLAIAADSVVSQEPLLLKGFPRTLRASPALLATATISTGQTTLLLDVAALESSVREPASDPSVASVPQLDRRKEPHV